MGIFSGMDKLGLGQYENMNVIEGEKSEPVQKVPDAKPVKSPEEREAEVLYDKRYVCPVCDLQFTSKCVKAGKVKLVSKDTDLRPVYEFMDPIKYDVLACDKCGYSALTRYFGKLSSRQVKDIHEEIGIKFKGLKDIEGIYSYDEAILRYKLALITVMVKKAKNSERAYTSLKLAWILRGKRNSMSVDDARYEAVYNDELDCIKNAYEGFTLAISNEPFPIAGMDENTLKYVMSDLARKLNKFDEAIKLLGGVITSKVTSNRLKDEALKLKELIKEDMGKA